MEQEIWKAIEKYPGYEVSSFGHIKSYKVDKNGRILQGKDSKGYVGIDFRVEGKTVQDLVHRVVLSTFSPIEGMENLTVNHKNGDTKDNHLDNLEWMTLSDNTAHARRVLGSGLGTRKIHIITLQREDKYFDTVTEAAEFMGVAKGTISRWAKGSRSYEGKARLVEYL
jgi:hypothetical protein